MQFIVNGRNNSLVASAILSALPVFARFKQLEFSIYSTRLSLNLSEIAQQKTYCSLKLSHIRDVSFYQVLLDEVCWVKILTLVSIYRVYDYAKISSSSLSALAPARTVPKDVRLRKHLLFIFATALRKHVMEVLMIICVRLTNFQWNFTTTSLICLKVELIIADKKRCCMSQAWQK